MAHRVPIVAAMDIWSALGIVVIVVLVLVAVIWRRRAAAAEATVHSVALLVDADPDGSDLVREVRARLSIVAEAEAYLGALGGASIGILIVDCAGEVKYTNPVGEELLAGDGEHAILATRVSALATRVCEHGVVEQIESDVRGPVRKVLTTTAVPLTLDAATVGSVALYIEDLSDQKRVDAMRTDFVANASHELKTPLGALSILAETLAVAEDDDTRSRLAGRLQAEALRMANVIDDVVQLAETESRGVEFETLAVSELVEEAADAVRSLAAEKRIDLKRGDVVDATIAASRRQIVSAIRNLLENAITYTAVKGEEGTVSYGARREGGSICIDVKDTGVGVPDRYADRVFERFFRVDRARSRESGGTGLGLSIVKNVALAHGGSVSLRSEVGVGSVFAICIPEEAEDTS